MITNYFKNAWRYFSKNRLFTALHILGLALGISSCWLIYRVVSYEFAYEEGITDRDHIFRLVTGRVFDGKETIYGGVSAPIYQGVREEIDGIDVVPVYGKWMNTVSIPQEGNEPVVIEEPEGIFAVDSSYFDLVSYRWLAGNKQTAFDQPKNVVLTESRAREYFPNVAWSSIVGRTIIYEDSLIMSISAVVQDLDYPTEFDGREFILLESKAYPLVEWTNTNGSDRLYLKLQDPNESNQVLAKIETLVDRKWKQFKEETKPTYKYSRWFLLEPLSEMHFATHIKEWRVEKTSKPILFGLIGAGVFILLLACINYVNLGTAQIPLRSKEIGVRRTLGGSSKALVGQFMFETTLIVLCSGVLAYILQWAGFAWLKDMLPSGISTYTNDITTLFFIVLLLSVTIFFSGIYPAWIASRVNPTRILKKMSVVGHGVHQFGLRKVLTVFQYTIAQVFVIGALVVGQQLHYTLHKDMGFNKDAVLLVDVPWTLTNKEKVLVDGFRNEAQLGAVTRGRAPITTGYSSSPYTYTSEQGDQVQRQLQRKEVDTAYINFYEMTLLAGRNLHGDDSTRELIINETAALELGFADPQDAIGKMLTQSGTSYPIVGVTKDFHTEDFYTEIQPVVLISTGATSSTNTVSVKLVGDVSIWSASIERMQLLWNKVFPDEPFNYEFYDQHIEAMYQKERNMAKLINLATGATIFISCLGLFGLVTLAAFQRTKEIGIRKVLGASVSSIVAMLSKDFVKLVCLAIIIASPIAWWAMNKWLEDFAYKIDIQWWMFALAGMLAIVIALLTVSGQAIRAAVANPVDSLRDE